MKFTAIFILSVIFQVTTLGASNSYELKNWNPPQEELAKIPAYQQIGDSVEDAYQFVSSSILIEAYEGALRGPRGSLLAKAASPLDQALLLANLFSHRGLSDLRIGRGTLDEATIDRLVQRLETDQAYRREQLVNESRQLEEQLDLETDLEKRQILERSIEDRRAIVTRLEKLLAEHQRILGPLLSDSRDLDEVSAQNEIEFNAELRSLFKTHYWMEAKIDNEWISFEPSLWLAPGEKLVASVDEYFDFAELPKELLYQIDFVVRAFYYQNNEAWAEDHLSLSANSATLSGQPLFLVHPAKGDGFYGAGGFMSAVGGLFGSDQKGWDFAPSFIVGRDFKKGSLLKTKDRHPGGLFSAGEPLYVAAEILIIKMTYPNGETIELERPIFDLVGLHQRQAAPNGPWNLKRESLAGDSDFQPRELQRLYVFAVQTGAIQSDYIETNFSPYQHTDSLESTFALSSNEPEAYYDRLESLENEYLSQLVLNDEGEMVRELGPDEVLQEDENGKLVPVKTGASPEGRGYEPQEFLPAQAQSIFRFHQFHDSLRALLDDGKYFGYLAEPSVTSFFVGVNSQDEKPDEPKLSAYLGLDLTYHRWTNSQSGDEWGSGVVSTLIEQMFAERLALIDPETEAHTLFTAENTILRSLDNEESEFVVLESEQDPNLQLFPPEAQEAIKSDLTDGFVIVHTKPVNFYEQDHFAWFVFDRDSLHAFDGTDVFLRQAITEKHITEAKDIIAKKNTACFYRQCLQAALGVAENSLHILRGRVSLDTAANLVEVLQDSKACAGKIKFKVRAPMKWKNHPDAFKKAKHMQSQARKGKLKTPKKEAYAGDRAKNPAEHGNPPNTPASTATEKRDWDHKSELACGGQHSKSNVWPLDRHMNRSMGSVIGRACAKLCEGTQITDIVYDWVAR